MENIITSDIESEQVNDDIGPMGPERLVGNQSPDGPSISEGLEVSCLVIGDPHFKTSNVRESRKMVTKICEKIVSSNPDFVVCLGDILHTHEKIHVEPLCLAIDFLKKMAELKPVYLIIGNHDRPNNSDFLSDKHAFNGLKDVDNIEIIDTTREFVIGGKRFVMVPYVYPGRFAEALSRLDFPLKGTTAIFAHQEFYGAKMGAIESREGDKWPLENPLVISGHIHDYDRLQDNMIYVGTPMQHSFGDKDDKTISLFQFWQDPITFSSRFREFRIDLQLIKRRTIRLKCTDFQSDWAPPQNALIKLIFYGNAAEIQAITKHPRIAALQQMGIMIAYKTSNDVVASLVPQAPERRNYLKTLYEKIEGNVGMIEVYNKLFVRT